MREFSDDGCLNTFSIYHILTAGISRSSQLSRSCQGIWHGPFHHTTKHGSSSSFLPLPTPLLQLIHGQEADPCQHSFRLIAVDSGCINQSKWPICSRYSRLSGPNGANLSRVSEQALIHCTSTHLQMYTTI